mmetsp:Transcript_23936/g.37280  ORF Transcript_23936/g.37280 Transcript_23936/m.37280 type:complete len:569 (-) Transcript_23936:50-1756(-)
MDRLADRHLAGIDDNVSVSRDLIGVINAGQTLQFPRPGLLVQALGITSFAHFDGGGDVDQDEPTAGGFNGALGIGAGLFVRGDGADDGNGTGLGDVRGDVRHTLDGGVSVLLGVAKVGREVSPEFITVEGSDRSATILQKGNRQSRSDGGLTRSGETSEENSEPLLVAGRVGGSEHLDHIGEGEPGGDVNSLLESATELGSGDGLDGAPFGDLVNLKVLSTFFDVDHVVVGQDLDAELTLEAADQVLGVIVTIEVVTVLVFTGSSVVTANNKVGGTVVLTDKSMPQSLSGSSHSHGKREETKSGHARGVGLQQFQVDPDSGEVIDISRLGHTDNRVDKHVGLGIASSTEGQLTVRAMHGVTGLEGNNTDITGLAESGSGLSRGHAEIGEVIVVGERDSLELSSHVHSTGLVVDVLNGRVALVIGRAENHLGFTSLVGSVDGSNSQDGEGVSVLITEGDPVSNLVLLGGLLADIEGDGHRPNFSVGQPGVLDHALVVILVEESLKGGETTIEEHLHIAQLARGEGDGGQIFSLFLQLVKGRASDKELLGLTNAKIKVVGHLGKGFTNTN